MYLKDSGQMWIAKGEERIFLSPRMANRHGLIAGATGTGKTVTIKVLAEAFSEMGVPVFMADIKGDVSGMCMPGELSEGIRKRVEALGIEGYSNTGYPVRFFDVFGQKGIPVRTTISDMGPELLSRILDLNDVQTGVLNIVFKVADDNGLLLLDLKDLRALIQYVGNNAKEYQAAYGNVTPQTIGAIQRAMLTLETSGGDVFFGEPALDIRDWIATNENGHGYINLLNCVRLVQSPLLYSTFLLWMLSELYELLPEAGDLEKPRIVFFFDEAHLLFADASKALLQKVEQVARLIRSKGVGVYFITQVPSDIPDSVLAQLGNKVQHALRAYTPKEQKAVRAAAESFRVNPAFDTEKALGELGTGEALVSFLGEDGIPQIVQRAFILPPRSYLGVADDAVIAQKMQQCLLYSKYAVSVDRESAYEKLTQHAQNEQQQREREAAEAQWQKEQAAKEAQWQKEQAAKAKQWEAEQKALQKEQQRAQSATTGKAKSTLFDKALNSTMSSAFSTVGREVGKSIVRGLFGTIKK